jgi:hypothetical protein
VKKKKQNTIWPESRVRKKMQETKILKTRTKRKSKKLRRNCSCSGTSGKRREETSI